MRLRLIFSGALGLALLAIGSAAAAQTTHCENTVYGMPQFGVTCKTDAPVDPKTALPKRCNKFEMLNDGPQICGAREHAAQAAEVGKLIADGKCDDAMRLALSGGDFDLARNARDFCKPKTPPNP